MNRLISFFESKDNKEKDIDQLLKQLSKDEEKEILQTLDLPKGAEIKESINQTLKHFKDPDSELGISFGTVRVKTQAGEVVGTVRVKEGEQEGTIRYVGTIKVKDGKETIESETEVPEWANFGFQSVRIVRDESDYGTVKCTSSREDVAFVYRPPEPWEISILALEKGEFNPEMKEEAFGKYKKKRKGVNDLFDAKKEKTTKRPLTDLETNFADLERALSLTLSDDSVGRSNSSRSHTRENSHSDKTDVKRYNSLERKKNAINLHDVANLSSSGASRDNLSPTTPTTTNSTTPDKERAWSKWRKENTDI